MMKEKTSHIRMTGSQEAEIRQKAGTRNFSFYCRRTLLNSVSGGPDLADELAGVRKELVRVGNNLNQIAKHANQTRELPDLEEAKAEIYRLIQQAGNALAGFR